MALIDEKTTNNMAENNVTGSQISTKEKEMENTPGTQNSMVFDGDIDLSPIRKKRFRIDGDNNRYLELNTSDMSIVNRLEQLYPKLEKLAKDASLKQVDLRDENNEISITKISQALTKIDMQMRDIIDDIFQSNVSEMCAPSGSMFDPFNGEFRYEHIIDVISKLYANNINAEFKQMATRLKKRTSKYTKKG